MTGRLIAIAVLVLLAYLPVPDNAAGNSLKPQTGWAGITLTLVDYPAEKPGHARFRLSNSANDSIYFSGGSLSEPLYTIYLPDKDYPAPTEGWRPVGPGWCGNGVHVVKLIPSSATDFYVRTDTLGAGPCRLGLWFSRDEWQKTSWVVMSDVFKDARSSTPPN